MNWQRGGGGGVYRQRPGTQGGGAPRPAPRAFGVSEEEEEAEPRNRARYLAAGRARFAQVKAKESYFDEDSEDEFAEVVPEAEKDDDDDGVDPLDAFMAGNTEVLAAPAVTTKKPERLDEAARDAGDEAMHDAQRGEKKATQCKDDEGTAALAVDGAAADENSGVTYRDGKAVVHPSTAKKTRITGLAAVDHSTRCYEAVPTCLIAGGVDAWNAREPGVGGTSEDLGVLVSPGESGVAPRCAVSFADMLGACEASAWLLKAVAKQGLETPTAVQAAAVPAALCGRDVLALAETGSGKTLAYGWPALAHASAQPASAAGEGPLVLVLCPTRELCEQIYREIARYARHSSRRRPLDTVAVFGGAGKYEMGRALWKEAADVAVATPGRLMELIAEEKTELQSRCTFFVIDEADRMFDLGFQDQVRSIAQSIRPSRQTIFTSATLAPKVDGLVRATLRDPIKVVVGQAGHRAAVANDHVQQEAAVVSSARDKWTWLAARLATFGGRCIVFVAQKKAVDELAKNLATYFPQIRVGALHGDLDANDRRAALAAFRKHGGLLVATDVAARGLDVHDVKVVVNFDAPKTMQDYVHRVGRTGRSRGCDGEVADGRAFTLLAADDKNDKAFAKRLVDSLRQSKRNRPSNDLLALAGFNPPATTPVAHGNFPPPPQQQQQQQHQRGRGAEIPPPSRINMQFAPPPNPTFGGPPLGQQQQPQQNAAELIAQFNARGSSRAGFSVAPPPPNNNNNIGPPTPNALAAAAAAGAAAIMSVVTPQRPLTSNVPPTRSPVPPPPPPPAGEEAPPRKKSRWDVA